MCHKLRFLAILLVLGPALGTAACTAPPAPTTSAPEAAATAIEAPSAAPEAATGAPTGAESVAEQPCSAFDKITLQLKWVAQAQFAGFYAANEADYKAACLEVTILPGGPDIIPEKVVAGGAAQFGLDWQPSLLLFREQGTPIQIIAQIAHSSGMREISWKESGIASPADLKGKNVAVWLGGNEYELLATLDKYKLDTAKDLTIVAQPFNMSLLLQKQVDAAAATTYNELAQVLEAKNPATGQLYKLGDLNIIDFNQEGTAMLEDGVFVREAWIKDPKNQDIAVRFLRASFRGWIHCRDHQAECVDIVLKAGPTLGKGHQTWQMNEFNKLIWPSPDGIGITDPALWQQSADIALKYGVIKKPADSAAYTETFARQALAGLADVDTKGLSWKAAVVEVTEGGR